METFNYNSTNNNNSSDTSSNKLSFDGAGFDAGAGGAGCCFVDVLRSPSFVLSSYQFSYLHNGVYWRNAK